ncbi:MULTISPECIES: hypothetical protein [unclassified Bradyrhizobium]|uniref:hypothetical protein n=1 Tax=unclassified Bradyrhizobium TaxID=2631580 RepID=UPI0028EF0123|nr:MULTISPECIES: hypothetical protein [unclassified Bradyrhizobium]
MHYPDGRIARLGDEVSVAGMSGRVVCSIDTREYSDDYPEQAWAYLQRSVMIVWDRQGLTHYDAPEAGMILVRRHREV